MKKRDDRNLSKKDMAIVFGVTDNYIFALCNVLLGMKKHHKKPFWDDVIVFHVDVTIENQNIANSILPCQFREIKDEIWLKQLREKLDEETIKMYSVAAMFRYSCFDLLKEYHKLFWPDCDILIQGDFSDIMKYGDESGYAACLSDGFIPIELSFKELIPGYNMFMPNYNSGTLVLSDKLPNYEEYCDWCKEKTIELADKLDMPDQGILNLLIQEYGIEPEIIDAYRYQCHPMMPQAMDRINTAIVHAYGKRKFWNDVEFQHLFPEWMEFHKQYQKIAEDITHRTVVDVANMPLVSVAMSTYTRIDFLKEAVLSILNQTYQNLELIVVVEKSEKQQETVKLLQSFEDERIVIIINEEKLGFGASLNVALDCAKGEFIARMDDDDVSLPQRFEKQVAYLLDNPMIDIVGSHVQTFMYCNDKWNTYPTDYEYARIELLRGTVVCHPSVMMRRNRLNEFGLRYDPNVFSEDYDLWARAVQYLNIANIPEVLYHYRSSLMNATVVSQAKVHASHLETMRLQLKKYLNLDPSPDELNLLNGRINIIDRTYDKHKKQAQDILCHFKRKIVEANKQTRFYNQEKLEIYLGMTTVPATKKVIECSKGKVKKKVRRALKSIIRPISDCVVWTFSRRTYEVINRRADGTLSRLNEVQNSVINMIHDNSDILNQLMDSILSQSKHIKELANLKCEFQKISNQYEIIENNQLSLFDKFDNYIKTNSTEESGETYLQKLTNVSESIDSYVTEFIDNNQSNLEKNKNDLMLRLNEIESSINTHAVWNTSDIQKDIFYIRFLLEKFNGLIDAKTGTSYLYNDDFYLNNIYHSYASARVVLGMIFKYIHVSSCIDVGCGCGTWLYAAKKLGTTVVCGLDGEYVNKNMLMIGEADFISCDLTQRYYCKDMYDLAMSMEVAEHIPNELSGNLIDTLCNASDIVLFSAAHVNQHGDGHINEQSYEYWVKQFKQREFGAFDIRTLISQKAEVCEWYRQNICLYIRNGSPAQKVFETFRYKE